MNIKFFWVFIVYIGYNSVHKTFYLVWATNINTENIHVLIHFIFTSMIIPMVSNWNRYMGDFLESFVWSSMDHSKNYFRKNYFIFKPYLFIYFLITTSFSYLLFKITISHLF
jgi:hypothetical protein